MVVSFVDDHELRGRWTYDREVGGRSRVMRTAASYVDGRQLCRGSRAMWTVANYVDGRELCRRSPTFVVSYRRSRVMWTVITYVC